MEHFAYSFLVTMLHSLWQAAFLWFLIKINFTIFSKQAPLMKRNLLLVFLGFQAAITGITFYLVKNNASLNGLMDPFYSISQLNITKIQSWSVIIFLIYSVIILIKTFYLLYTWQQFKDTQRLSMQKPPIQLRLFTHAKAMEFGIKRKVVLWFSEKVTTPITYGFLKPVILLPVALVNQLTTDEAESLIIHELSHIKSKDFIWNWLVIAMETIYCFNPFIYYIAKQVKSEREKSCDVQVIHFKYAPLIYAEALLKTAMTRQASLSFQIGAVKSNQELFNRIHFFSNPANFNFNKHGSIIFFLLLPLILVFNVLAITQVVNQKSNFSVEPVAAKIFSLTPSKENSKDFVAEGVMKVNEDEVPVEMQEPPQTPLLLVKTENEVEAETKIQEEPVYNSAGEQPAIYSVINVAPLKKEIRDVIIQETNSAGEIITIALQAELNNGEWIMQPLWMLSETRIKLDSTTIRGKDSVLKMIPSVQ